jgi:hypothetical protein
MDMRLEYVHYRGGDQLFALGSFGWTLSPHVKWMEEFDTWMD